MTTFKCFIIDFVINTSWTKHLLHTHTQAHACVCVQACERKSTQNVLQKICRQATTLPQLQALRDSQLSVKNCPLRLLFMKFLKLHIECLEPAKSHQVRTFVTKITWKTPIKILLVINLSFTNYLIDVWWPRTLVHVQLISPIVLYLLSFFLSMRF